MRQALLLAGDASSRYATAAGVVESVAAQLDSLRREYEEKQGEWKAAELKFRSELADVVEQVRSIAHRLLRLRTAR